METILAELMDQNAQLLREVETLKASKCPFADTHYNPIKDQNGLCEVNEKLNDDHRELARVREIAEKLKKHALNVSDKVKVYLESQDIKHTPLQMVVRGQGLREVTDYYPSDDEL